MTNHKHYDQPRELRELQLTTRATIDHETYDWPQESYERPWELWPTTSAMTDHESYDWPRELMFSELLYA